jgi:hypothetical protein
MTMTTIGRRSFLSRVGLGAGAGLFTAMLDPWVRAAHAQVAAPRRLIIYVNNLSTESGYLPTQGPNGMTFIDGVKPLQPFAKDLLVISNLRQPFNNTFHGASWGLIGDGYEGYDRMGKAVPNSPPNISIDRLIAAAVGKSDPFPSLALAPVGYAGFPAVSADGPGKLFPPEANPAKAFDTLFARSGTQAPSNSAPDFAERVAREKRFLDHLRQDVRRLESRLAMPERAKLQQYLGALQGVEDRLMALARVQSTSCARPTPPSGLVVKERIGDPAVFEVFSQITVNALACNLTKVCVLNSATGIYPSLGSKVGDHDMWHGGLVDDLLPAPVPKGDNVKYYDFHTGVLAGLRKKLQATPDPAGGTLADRTMIIWWNTGGSIHHHDPGDPRRRSHYYMLFLGTGGAFQTGRVVDANGQFVAQALVSVANAMGAGIKTFGGSPAKYGSGPLAALT